MKKVFLTLTMLLFAFVGVMKADVVVGDGGTTTNSYLPSYSYYNYSLTQQIYTPAEIGATGTITSIAFYNASAARTRTYDVYMVNTAKGTFSGNADWITVTASDRVYSGSVTLVSGDWTVITFTTPFEYDGTQNLAVIVDDNTGSWESSFSCYVFNATNQAIRVYSDGTNYDPMAPTSYSGTVLSVKNQIKLGGISRPANVTTSVATIDLGYRPNGAWMAPAVFELSNTGGPAVVSAVTSDNNFFTVNTEVPFVLTSEEPVEVEVSTGTAAAGLQEGNIVVVYTERGASVIPITATAYNPIDGDVVETAIVVPATDLTPEAPYTNTISADLYANYELPAGNYAKDAVYEVTFDSAVLFTASVNGVAYLYENNGVCHPAADNNFVYELPGSTGGATTFTEGFEGGLNGWNVLTVLTDGGEWIHSDNNLGGYDYTTLAHGGTGFAMCYSYVDYVGSYNTDSYMYTPQKYDIVAGSTLNFWADNANDSYPENFSVCVATADNPTANDFTQVWSGGAKGTGNGDAVRHINNRYENWRSHSIDLSAYAGQSVYIAFHDVNYDMYEIWIDDVELTTGSKSNRDMQTVLNEGFEDGSMPTGWTQEGAGNSVWYVGSGDYSSSTGAATGTYNALCTHGTLGSDQYLVTPTMDLSNATSATLSCNYINRSWAGDTDGFGVYYRVNGGAWNELMYTTTAHSAYTAYQVELEGLAANYQIGFRYYDNYGYGVALDDVVVTADITAGGGGGPVVVFDQEFIPAGTYDVVFATNEDALSVEMFIERTPLPVAATITSPEDGATGVVPPCTLNWSWGDYTEEVQVMFGSVYPPTTEILPWTGEQITSIALPQLQHNKTYFVQVNARNSSGTTEGAICGFTTVIDGVEGFAAETTELYPGDAAVFNWTANGRSLKGYNIYQDGVKLNTTPIVATTYTVEGLTYNMTTGYEFYVTALYDEGESEPSNTETVYMTGMGSVNGHVWEYDSITPIYNVAVEVRGTDEYGHDQTIYVGTTNPSGFYEGQVLAGTYKAYGVKDGYNTEYSTSDQFDVVYDVLTPDMDIILIEDWAPLSMIKATEEENDVLVEWSWDPAELIIDFETGDFSQFEFTLPASYPWAVTTTNPHEGTYCMKSTCEGVTSGSSTIQATVEVPYDAKMGFWVKVSSEANYDKFHFYIDGIEQGSALSGNLNYQYKEYNVEAGTHTYKWEYTKDSSVNSNDDCVYVDDITMYRQDVPVPPTPGATTYTFDGSTMEGWTSLDANNDGYGWVLGSEIGGVYLASGASLSGSGHNSSADLVCSGSYSNATSSAITPDNYLVSPAQITAHAGASIHFYACAQDASYAAEHFGVAVSTTTATAAAFTTIQEWTMTAKGVQGSSAEREFDIRGTRAQGNWYEYTVDLSSYANQNIWVAIRHFNCNDQFILNVDDITVNDGSAKREESNRTLTSFKLYRRDINGFDNPDDAEPVLIASPGVDVTSYIDNAWPTLPYGVYQWGIQAYYEGNHNYPVKQGAPVDPETIESCGTVTPGAPMRAMWDLLTSFGCTSGYQYGVATDGEYIYTSSWSASSSSQFYKYDMDGNFIEEFNVSGSGQIRDLTYDGQYFYGVANASTIYCLDLANHTLVSTISSSYGAMRCCGYDSERDGFWVVGNWSGNLSLVDRTGAVVITGPAPTSASGVAYFKDNDGVEHVYCFNNGSNDIDDYNIATNTITSAVFNFNSTPGYASGSSGGCHIANYGDKLAFYGDLQQSPNLIGVYELADAPVAPTPGTNQGFGYSDIIWSNEIEKDMYAEVTFNIQLNNNQSPAGTEITLTDGDGEDAYTGTVEENSYVFEAVRKAEYTYSVELDGYNAVTDLVMIEADTVINLTLEEQLLAVGDLYVSPTGWAKWGAGFSGGSGSGTGGGTGSTFSVNFDDGQMPAGWTVVDANNDNYTWVLGSNIGGVYLVSGASLAGSGHNSSNDMICCGSYSNATSSAITPNDYLVSPQVTLVNGSTFSFWACAQDASYAAEHYGVFVSDNGTSDWTEVQSWTMTAKGGSVMSNGRDGQMRAQGSWYQKTVDLSAFAGQKYIAIRHFECNDQFILDVDDIELTAGSKGDRVALSYKVKRDGAYEGETEYSFWQHDVDNLNEGDTVVTSVAAVYATGMSDWETYEWVYTPCDNYEGMVAYEATVADDQVTLTWTLPEGDTITPPPTGATTFTEGFEGGLNGWNVLTVLTDGGEWIHSDNNLGGYDYTTLAHGGTGFAMCYSYVDYVGSYNTDSYMYTPQKYDIVAGSTLNFWADNANDSYPENFSVCVATADNPTANDFTQVWSGGAKGTGNGDAVRHINNRYENWRSHSIDLSAYAGQSVYIAFHDVNYDMYEIWIDDVELTTGTKGNRNPWDLIMTFTAAEGGHYGVAYDGTNFYTSNWGYSAAAHNFYKYDLDGNMIEGFEISGCGTLRGMTYDGEYFYGVANSSTVYCVDLANHSVVNTFTSAYGAMRGITYDPVRDGFWVIGNWSGNLTLIDRTGAIVQTGPAPTSASDLAYYKDDDDVEHVYCFNNGTNDVEDWVIGNGSMGSSVFNFSSTPGFASGSSGGCTVGNYNGKMAFIGDIQQSPNLIGVYELSDSAPVPPVPPTPTGDVIGAVVYRDGEYLDFVAAPTATYVDTEVEDGDHEYCVRVVYADYAMSCMECLDVTFLSVAENDVVDNLYPNPTHDIVTIEAQGMNHITVVNTLGQVLYDAEVDADMMQVNLGQFQAGLYLIRVSTQNGVSVKRVTVVK